MSLRVRRHVNALAKSDTLQSLIIYVTYGSNQWNDATHGRNTVNDRLLVCTTPLQDRKNVHSSTEYLLNIEVGTSSRPGLVRRAMIYRRQGCLSVGNSSQVSLMTCD
jgi:hypothetical protein